MCILTMKKKRRFMGKPVDPEIKNIIEKLLDFAYRHCYSSGDFSFYDEIEKEIKEKVNL